MIRNSRFFAVLAFAALSIAGTPGASQNMKSGDEIAPRVGSDAPREIMGSTSAVQGDRVVCLYDKPSRKMICRTFDRWRVIGIQRSAKRNFEKSADR